MQFKKDGLLLELLPHRPHVQPKKNNSHVGGVLRWFEPLEICPSRFVACVANAVPLASSSDWQVDVHQWRTCCNSNSTTISVPEGPHCDGHKYVSILVVKRCNILGAETQLFKNQDLEAFYRTTLMDGIGLVLDDTQMLHYTTEIMSIVGDGFRDIFVITFNEWECRHYGLEFEKDAVDPNAIGSNGIELQ